MRTLLHRRTVEGRVRIGLHVAVEFDTTAVQPDQIRKRLEKMGYEITDFESEDRIR